MEAMFAATRRLKCTLVNRGSQKLTRTYAVNTLLGPCQASEEEVREHSWDRGVVMSQNLLVGLVL